MHAFYRMKKVISNLHIQREEAVAKTKIQSYISGATSQPLRRRMRKMKIQTPFDCFNTGKNTGKACLSMHISAIKPYWTLIS